MKSFVKLVLFFGTFFYAGSANAQICDSCTVRIATLVSTSYTVNSGEVFCVDTLGCFTGSLTLNGGTICNRGTFKPQHFVFNSGLIKNYARASLTGAFSLDSTMAIDSEIRSFFRVTGSVNLAGGDLINKGIFNISTSLSFVSGLLTNSGIINCKTGSGLMSVSNSGIINKD